MYCNGRTSEKRDTALVSRTGYDGEPGERDLIKYKTIFNPFHIHVPESKFEIK
jgi:hypothetical protein